MYQRAAAVLRCAIARCYFRPPALAAKSAAPNSLAPARIYRVEEASLESKKT